MTSNPETTVIRQEAIADILRQFAILFWLWKDRQFQRVNRQALHGLLDLARRGSPAVRPPVFLGSLSALISSSEVLLDLEDKQESLYIRHLQDFAAPEKSRSALGIREASASDDDAISFLDRLIRDGWVADVSSAAAYGVWLRYLASAPGPLWERWRGEVTHCERLKLGAAEAPSYSEFLRHLHVFFVRLVETYWTGRILLHAPHGICLDSPPPRGEVIEELDRLDAQIAELRRPFRHPWLSLRVARFELATVHSQRGVEALRREARTMSLSRPLFPFRWGELLTESVVANIPIASLLHQLHEELSEGFRLGYDCLNALSPEEVEKPSVTETSQTAPRDGLAGALLFLINSRPPGMLLGIGDLQALPGFANEDRVEVVPLSHSQYVVEIRYGRASPGVDLASRVLLHLDHAIALAEYLRSVPDDGLLAVRFTNSSRSQVIVLQLAKDKSPLLVVPAEGQEVGQSEILAALHLQQTTGCPVGMPMGHGMTAFLDAPPDRADAL